MFSWVFRSVFAVVLEYIRCLIQIQKIQINLSGLSFQMLFLMDSYCKYFMFYFYLFRFFAIIIFASTFNFSFMASTFYLLLTGHGKGIFNLMISSLLLINNEDLFSIILAACVGLTGIFFISLSCMRNLSDEGLEKVTAIYSKNL